jgi:hypothetical protein
VHGWSPELTFENKFEIFDSRRHKTTSGCIIKVAPGQAEARKKTYIELSHMVAIDRQFFLEQN